MFNKEDLIKNKVFSGFSQFQSLSATTPSVCVTAEAPDMWCKTCDVRETSRNVNRPESESTFYILNDGKMVGAPGRMG